MRSFLQRLRPLSATQLEEAVRAIAVASVPKTTERLGDDVHQMNRSELRGYVRARSRRVVRIELRKHFAPGDPLPQSVLDTILNKVLDQVSQQLVRRHMQQPAAIAVRRAA